MTILNKLMFWRKQEPKAPDAFEQIRALAPPYLINKDYLTNNTNDSCAIDRGIFVFGYKRAK